MVLHLNLAATALPRTGCGAGFVPCIERILGATVYTLTRPFLGAYFSGLYSQAEDKWRHLPQRFVDLVQDYYPEVDLSSVRYATGVKLRPGYTGLTYDRDVFFAGEMDFANRSHLKRMLHELTHVEQYASGVGGFLVSYVGQATIQLLRLGRLDVHDAIAMERSADEKARVLMDEVFSALNS